MKCKIPKELDVTFECRQYGISTWQCPQFLFLVMGMIVIITALSGYYVGTIYVDDPRIVAFVILILSSILMVMNFAISGSFGRLAEANKMKSEFISIVSHQLRTPLSNLNWATELLRSGKLGPIEEKQVEYFRILHENTNRMRELINDLLMVSRIETQTLLFKEEAFSLSNIVDDLVEEFFPIAKASHVDIDFDFAPDLPELFGDAFQIKQVVSNLIDNAIRYIKGEGLVRIKLIRKDDSLYFEIKDNGAGISQEDHKYIFSKFFRSENALKYQTQGSGLGLYIAKSIIKKAKGHMGFSSQENKGSTFWFTLPIKNI
ncbi:MAG: HAMP domain-containing sensor histidine kinase [Patescibacteria group bacterium]